MQEQIIFSLSKSDFQDMIAETVMACFRHTLPNPTPAQDPKPLTIQQAADYLNLSVHTLYGKVHKGELPHLKRGKKLYFLEEDLKAYLMAGRKKSNAEIEAEAENYLSEKKKGGVKYGK